MRHVQPGPDERASTGARTPAKRSRPTPAASGKTTSHPPRPRFRGPLGGSAAGCCRRFQPSRMGEARTSTATRASMIAPIANPASHRLSGTTGHSPVRLTPSAIGSAAMSKACSQCINPTRPACLAMTLKITRATAPTVSSRAVGLKRYARSSDSNTSGSPPRTIAASVPGCFQPSSRAAGLAGAI